MQVTTVFSSTSTIGRERAGGACWFLMKIRVKARAVNSITMSPSVTGHGRARSRDNRDARARSVGAPSVQTPLVSNR
jgi:hypothetical protein